MKSMPLKEKFNVTSISHRNKRHDSPHRSTGETPGFGQEAEAEVRKNPCLYWGFYKTGKARQGKQFRIGWFE